MCWSREISLRFACLDTFIVALLVARALDKVTHQPTFAGTHAALMACVALQEWAQFGIWKRNRLGESSCGEADILLSILTTGAAELLPLTVIATSFFARGTNEAYRNKMRQLAMLLWAVQFFVVVGSVVKTHKFCVQEGHNHHQVWVCESATYQVGGHFLHYSTYWIYVFSCLLAAEAVDGMPIGERRGLQGIGLISAIVSVVLYGRTLEACSVWCWSAFALGMCLCAQVYGYNDALSFLAKKVGVQQPCN